MHENMHQQAGKTCTNQKPESSLRWEAKGMDKATEDRPAPPLEIRLFGPFEARVLGKPLPRLRSRKGKWLLALLTLHHDRPVERGWLAGTFWPDSPDRQALY